MSEGEMSFWDHLNELRGVLVRVAALVAVLAVGLFFAMPYLFDNVVLWPCEASFPTFRAFDFLRGDGMLLPDLGDDTYHVSLVNINLGTQLMTHLSTSFYVALIIAFPFVIRMLWGFISPGLYEHERRGARRAWVWGNVMFYIGLLTGYFVVFPMALRFLSQYTLSSLITNTLTLESYMDNFYMTIFAMGLVFELPVLAWMLGKAGVLGRGFFSKYRKYAIVVIAALATFITPTSDIFTLFVVFVPIYALWEMSALLVPKRGND